MNTSLQLRQILAFGVDHYPRQESVALCSGMLEPAVRHTQTSETMPGNGSPQSAMLIDQIPEVVFKPMVSDAVVEGQQ
jgi:hypothetical protein